MLELVPAGADADLDPPAAHLVDRRDDLGEVAGVAEGDRRDERAEPDPVGLAGEPGQDGPGVGRRLAGRSREALVVVGPEERLEPVGLGALGDRDLVAVAQALLGLEHQREAHRSSSTGRPSGWTEWFAACMIVHMARSMRHRRLQPDDRPAIIADLRASFGELKCIGSERLVRQGISMTQLHVLNLLERHGEMAMSRLAEMLDVSMSNATGLVDRIEERGYVERIRVPSDRRVVLVRITDGRTAVARRHRLGAERDPRSDPRTDSTRPS